jgi:serine/threonine protein kinase
MANPPNRLQQSLAERYAIERDLGRGGMAVVMLARDLKHQRRVAIKVLRPELSQSLGTDRFLLEIEVAAQLTHPHILPVFDSGAADGEHSHCWRIRPAVFAASATGTAERLLH